MKIDFEYMSFYLDDILFDMLKQRLYMWSEYYSRYCFMLKCFGWTEVVYDKQLMLYVDSEWIRLLQRQ